MQNHTEAAAVSLPDILTDDEEKTIATNYSQTMLIQEIPLCFVSSFG